MTRTENGSHPELCVDPSNTSCPIVAPDSSNEAWWAWLTELVDELTAIFPDAYFHGGADEFQPACWVYDANVAKWMEREGFTTAEQVLDVRALADDSPRGDIAYLIYIPTSHRSLSYYVLC
jgi:hypothetical protein